MRFNDVKVELFVEICRPCRFEHGEVTNYIFDGVSIHPVTTKIRASFLTQLPERKETAQGIHHEANVDFKTVSLLAVMWEN